MSLIKTLQLKMSQVVLRGVVKIVNDATKRQNVQLVVMADETLDGVERFQNYGYTSKPHAGSEAIALTVNGNKSHTVVIAVEDKRFRLTGLDDGEVAMYDDLGNKIVLRRDSITIDAITALNINSPLTTVTGNMTVTGQLTAGGINMNTHTHTGDSGGSTSGPNA